MKKDCDLLRDNTEKAYNTPADKTPSQERAEKTADLHKKFAEDAERFNATGEMASYTGSFFTRNKAEVMLVAAGINLKFTLTEEVEEERLRAALREAVKVCPYVAYSLRFNDTTPRLTFVKSDDDFPVFRDYMPQSYAEKELKGHFGFVSFSGREIAICICHAITDGYGSLQFINALFQAYFATISQAEWTANPDWAADVMKYPWPLPENGEPPAEDVEDTFRLPQGSKDGGGLHRHFFIDRRAFKVFRRNTGLSHQGAVAYILAKTLQTVHPNNDKVIKIRCPIDTRTALGVPHTFQNASVPHLYLKFRPQNLLSPMTEEDAKIINDEAQRQISYDYVARMTNIFAAAAKSDNKADFDDVILNYVRQSELCVSYIGGMTKGTMSKFVTDMTLLCEGAQPFPIILYFWELGDKINVLYDQDFDDDSYWKALCRTLDGLGITANRS